MGQDLASRLSRVQKELSLMGLKTAVSRLARFLFSGVVLIAGFIYFSAPRLKATQAPSHSVPATSAEALRLNTLGVAFLNQQKGAEAQKYFEQALAADPKFGVARLNLGIAFLSQQKLEQGRTALEQAIVQLPKDPYAWYNLGLAYKDLGEPQKGIAAFEHVTQVAPDEPDAYYFIGFLDSQLQKYDEAISSFKKALSLFPYHASAQFGLARAYQRKGEADAAREAMKVFQKNKEAHLGEPFGAAYGEQGQYSLGEFVRGAEAKAPAEIPVRFVQESLAKRISASGAPLTANRGACFIDFDADGKPDLFLVAAAKGKSRLLHNVGDGKFEDVTEKAGLAGLGEGYGCAAGDFDNDTHPDLAVCESSGIRLFRNEGNGKFADVTARAGIRREPGCVAATLVDYDHDGDLDLYISMAPAAATERRNNRLWRNNGNSTFTDVSETTGLGIPATGGGIAITDFNNDRAVDFVFAGGSGGASIYLNPREGKFTSLPAVEFASEKLPPAVGVTIFDFDKDGFMDVAFTHAGSPGLSLWRNVQGKKLERVPLPDLGWEKGWGLTWLDYDNDGWVDLVAVGESSKGAGELRLLRNLGDVGWSDVTKKVQLDALKLSQPRAIAFADLKANGNTDLIVTQEDAPPVLLENIGANKNNWIAVDLRGLNDNKSGIGTKVELFAGPLYQKFEVSSASGYLSQNGSPLLVGLGSHKVADAIRLLWPTGVPQDEVDLAALKTVPVGELDRRGSSCPILFSWNGKEYEFIADMIGPAVVGHWIAPGERDVPDPDEYLKVPAKKVREKNGLLSFRFLEPMEETVYLDQVRLLAIDHPASVEINPDERFVSNPPFPEFRVIATQNAHLPVGAWDDRGKNVLPLLARKDRRYVSDFPNAPFTGFAKLHWVELQLGPWDSTKPLRLLLDGYTDYFTATSMYAADQAGIKVIAPYVEAQDPRGNWSRVMEDMGFPAGLARTMVADLSGKLPPATTRIRIVTNLKIYWDSVRIDQTPERDDVRVNEIPLADANLAYIGYPREIRLKPASDTVYSYSELSPTGPYSRAAGNYTRYGDVKSLLNSSDDKFAIFSSGEGLKLDFDPRSLPALPAGWIRDYFFYADGFEKDLDFYAAHAFTVEPLPRHGLLAYPYPAGQEYPVDDDHLGYELEYNTRTRSDRFPENLRYNYPAPK
jgi:tetratricopeptide (TPR) repeat protein